MTDLVERLTYLEGEIGRLRSMRRAMGDCNKLMDEANEEAYREVERLRGEVGRLKQMLDLHWRTRDWCELEASND